VGDFKTSSRWLDQALELPAVDRSIEAWIHVYRGYSFSERARWARASESSRTASEIAMRLDDPWPAAWGRITDGYAVFMAGRHRDGHSILRQAVDELVARGLLYTISWAYALLAEVSLLLGEAESGVKLSRASRDALRDGDRIGEPMACRAVALAGALSDTAGDPPDWADVLSHLQSAVEIARDAGRLPQAAVSHFRYAECLQKKGDPTAALGQLSQAERLFADLEMIWWSEQAAALRARIEAAKPFVWFAPCADGPPGLVR
jgi:tetratricopeptide (TPR) repeat protein